MAKQIKDVKISLKNTNDLGTPDRQFYIYELIDSDDSNFIKKGRGNYPKEEIDEETGEVSYPVPDMTKTQQQIWDAIILQIKTDEEIE